MTRSYLTDREQDSVSRLRIALGSEIPPEFDTDFHLRRWVAAYDHDLQQCERVFREYLLNRSALGHDQPGFTKSFYEREDVRQFGDLLRSSKLTNKLTNSIDNGLVFVEMPMLEPSKVVQVFSSGRYLRMFIGYCEYFQHLILEQEKQTGRPSHGICIYDQKGSGLTPYLNPVGPVCKLVKMRINVWTDYYSEVLEKVLMINSPTFLSLIWKVASSLLPRKVHSRFVFASKLPQDLLLHLDSNVVPRVYGGQLNIAENLLPNGCNRARLITENDFGKNGQIWTDHGLEVPVYKNVVILAGQTIEIGNQVFRNGKLLYEFHTNGEVQFSATKCENGRKDGILIAPKLKLMTTKLSEQEAIPIESGGRIILIFTNTSNYFQLKIKLAIQVI